MEGVSLTPLTVIKNEKGDIYKCIDNTDLDYNGFGELYFSAVNPSEIKGWTKHTVMTLNLIVNTGEICVVIYDDRKESKTYNNFYSVRLSINNYKRLSISPGLWVALKGIGNQVNLVLNFADILHDPNEHIKLDLEEIAYNWEEL